MNRHQAVCTLLAASAAASLLVGAGVAVAAPETAYYQQKVDWAPCKPDPNGPPVPWEKMDCATVIVPLDYRHPDAGNLSIAVSRTKAKDKRQGVLLLNPGGPGGGGLFMPLALENNAVAGSYDLIGFDPRGVGRSTQLRCETPPDGLFTTRPTDAQLPVIAADAQQREAACQRAAGGIRPFINTANTARDMDVIRAVLGEKKINYLGFSYGTYLGAVYGSLFPGKLNRSVLDSSMHPEWLYYEQSKQQAVAAKQNVDAWVNWVSQRDKTFHLGSTPDKVYATLDALGVKLDAKPVDLDDPPPGVPAFKHVDRTFFEEILGVTRYRDLWAVFPQIIHKLQEATGSTVSADTGKALSLLAGMSIKDTRSGVFQTVTCEADWPRDLNTYYDQMKLFREKYPYGPGAMAAAPTECSFRSFTPPEKPVDLKRAGYPTGLVVQAEFDGNTQYDGGPAMADALNDNLISISDEGAHGQYGGNECATKKIDDYLINGVLPGSRSVCAGTPRPDVPSDNAPGPRTQQQTSLESQIRAAITTHHLNRGF